MTETGERSDEAAAAAARDDAMLLDWLRERDTECPLCRYNLRGLTVPRCPECGNPLRLSVSLAEPYAKAWITLAVVVCGSAGMGALLLCLVLRKGRFPDQDWLGVAMTLMMLMIPTPAILLSTRRRFQRLSRSQQWMVTGIVSIWPVGAWVLLCAALR